MVIVDKSPSSLPFTPTSSLWVTSVSSSDFNVLLAQSMFVIVPASIPQSTPVGIGTLAKVRMARKIPIATKDTGTENMITEGYDGFFVENPSAESEKEHRNYERIYTRLLNETYRREIEENIDTMLNTYEVAGAAAMVKFGKCVASAAIHNTTEWTLHRFHDCQECPRHLCNTWVVEDQGVGKTGAYRSIGPELGETKCDILNNAATDQVVKNPTSGELFAAVACASRNLTQ